MNVGNQTSNRQLLWHQDQHESLIMSNTSALHVPIQIGIASIENTNCPILRLAINEMVLCIVPELKILVNTSML